MPRFVAVNFPICMKMGSEVKTVKNKSAAGPGRVRTPGVEVVREADRKPGEGGGGKSWSQVWFGVPAFLLLMGSGSLTEFTDRP